MCSDGKNLRLLPVHLIVFVIFPAVLKVVISIINLKMLQIMPRLLIWYASLMVCMTDKEVNNVGDQTGKGSTSDSENLWFKRGMKRFSLASTGSVSFEMAINGNIV